MKKSDFAKINAHARNLEGVAQDSLENMCKGLSAMFSGIASNDPDMALSVLDQLNNQRDAITQLKKDKAEQFKKTVQYLTSKCPQSIEFEEEDESEEYTEEDHDLDDEEDEYEN